MYYNDRKKFEEKRRRNNQLEQNIKECYDEQKKNIVGSENVANNVIVIPMEDNVAMAKSCVEQPKELTKHPSIPAVIFENVNVYTHNQKVSVPNKVYNTLADVYYTVMDSAIDRIDNNMSATISSELSSIQYCSNAVIDTIISNFDETLNNCLMFHLSNMNEYFVLDKDAPPIVNLLPDNNMDNPNNPFHHILNTSFSIKSIINDIVYASSYDEQCNLIANGYLSDRACAFVNNLGMNVYAYIRRKLNSLFISIDIKDPMVVENIVNSIDHEFCLMMQDFSYESAVFATNIAHHYNCIPVTQDRINQLRKLHNDDDYIDEPF